MDYRIVLFLIVFGAGFLSLNSSISSDLPKIQAGDDTKYSLSTSNDGEVTHNVIIVEEKSASWLGVVESVNRDESLIFSISKFSHDVSVSPWLKDSEVSSFNGSLREWGDDLLQERENLRNIAPIFLPHIIAGNTDFSDFEFKQVTEEGQSSFGRGLNTANLEVEDSQYKGNNVYRVELANLRDDTITFYVAKQEPHIVLGHKGKDRFPLSFVEKSKTNYEKLG